MENTIYVISFHYKDPENTMLDELEYTNLQEAWKAMRIFTEPQSSEIYSRIDLLEVKFPTRIEKPISSLYFA